MVKKEETVGIIRERERDGNTENRRMKCKWIMVRKIRESKRLKKITAIITCKLHDIFVSSYV